MRKRIFVAAPLCVLWIFAASVRGEFREWISETGRQIEATYLGTVEERFWLATPQGDIMRVRWEEFQPADQAYIQEQLDIAEAERRIERRFPTWDVAVGDHDSIETLTALVKNTVVLSLPVGGTLGDAAEVIEIQLKELRDSPRRFAIRVGEGLNVDTPIRIQITERPAYQVIELLSRSIGASHRLDQGRVVLEPVNARLLEAN